MTKAATDKPGRGRKGGGARLRQMLVLISALDEAGDTLSVESIRQRLSVSTEDAEKLMSMLVEVAGDEGSYVPLAMSDDGSEISLAYGDGAKGRAVRLTRGETFAILSALDQMGVPADDPVRKSVQEAFADTNVEAEDVERLSAPLGTTSAARTLETCVRAIVDQARLAFLYKGSRDAASRERTVDPTGIHQEDGIWYLDGFDIDRQAPRVFRLDRASDAREKGKAEPHPAVRPGADADQRLVTLAFDDAHHLDLFDWHETSRRDLPDGSVVVRTPYLGDWLPRHVAACGRHVSSDDAILMQRAREWAGELAGMVPPAEATAATTGDALAADEVCMTPPDTTNDTPEAMD